MVLLLLPALVWLGAAFCAAQTPPSATLEERVKAAYLYRFTRYVEWPEDAFTGDEAIVIGVVGDSNVAHVLRASLSNKRTAGRRLEVRRFSDVESVRGCHIVFLPNSRAADAGKLVARVRGQSVLTVGESAGFCAQGGNIQLYLDANKVRFLINLETTKKAGLKISSKLLRLGKIHDEG